MTTPTKKELVDQLSQAIANQRLLRDTLRKQPTEEEIVADETQEAEELSELL